MRKLLVKCLVVAGLICGMRSGALADVTDIYAGASITVQPNVLIIFDNSGSMDTADVPGAVYAPANVYSGSYSPGKVYNYECVQFKNKNQCLRNEWVEFSPAVSDIGCSAISEALAQNGYASGRLASTSPYACSNNRDDEQSLRTGNYLNYLAAELGVTRRRIDVAKEVVTDLVANTEGIRFGLMKFRSDNQGGILVRGCGSASKATLIADIAGLTAETWTPLAETLAEAGLYFAGQDSWYNTGVRYTSPMQYRCQKNYIIIVTDGEPTQDNDAKLTTGSYINGDVIGDHDGDGVDPGTYASNGTDYLDDVANYLYTNDCHPTLGDAGDQFEQQPITTYTIGFRTDQPLLMDTANNGGGQYFTATNASSLKQAFASIIGSIQERNAIYVAPVVPVSRLNKTYAGNRVYMGFFKPKMGGRWLGNLKAYTLTNAGEMLDVHNQPVTDSNGLLLSTAQSHWSVTADGAEVDEGGVGEVLTSRATARNIYTYLGQASLTHADNAFTVANTSQLTSALLGTTDANRTSLINLVRAETSAWRLGDIIHSEPFVVPYDLKLDGNGRLVPFDPAQDAAGSKIGRSYIFVGANDGMLHVFDDDDGSEAWAFVPPGQLGRLSLLGDTQHDYFVDGSFGLVVEGTVKTLMFGERRGGKRYYALDVTSPLSPVWKFQVRDNALTALDGDSNGVADGVLATLGEAWAQPQPQVVKVGGVARKVFLLTGGYDSRQDTVTAANLAPALAGNDTVGRALYAVRADTGAVYGLNVNGGNWNAMTHCIVDALGMDAGYDGVMDRVYAGDLGGKVFALKDDNADGLWDKTVLLDLPETLTVQASSIYLGQKFIFKPDVTIEADNEYVFIGTGDREHPSETRTVDAFYAMKYHWQQDLSNNYKTLQLTVGPTTEDTDDLTDVLVDVTDNLVQQLADDGTDLKNLVNRALQAGSGWYFRLPNAGEKVVASPVLFNKVVYFTTFTPGTAQANVNDPCTTSTDRGIARLYAVNYQNGAAVYNNHNPDPQNPALTKEDRSVIIGTSMPSAPVIAILRDGPTMFVGVEGGVRDLSPDHKSGVFRYYWRQIR